MRWLQTEYLLKGVFLGLVLYAGLQEAALPAAQAWPALGRTVLLTLGGLTLALLVAAVQEVRRGARVGGRLIAFVLFLLLESPTLTYVGILGGALAGVFLNHTTLLSVVPEQAPAVQSLLVTVLGGAALAGLVFGVLRQVRHRMARLGLTFLLGATLVVGGLSVLGVDLKLIGKPSQTYVLALQDVFAAQLLAGIPFFYLLTFAGHEEESEVEIAAMCAMLGLGAALWLDALKVSLSGPYSSPLFLVPVLLYFGYTLRVLPGLRVLKHAFRGFGYHRVGRPRKALLAFRRALQLDPTSALAREGFWAVHSSLDLGFLASDPQTLALVDLDLCLERAGGLLLQRPGPAQLAEARQLLDLVLGVNPDRQPQVHYWHAVAAAHGRDLDAAAAALERILDPATYGADNPQRRAVLLPAWQLALTLHDGLRQRVGIPILARPGRRMEAIAAVERHLAENPGDQGAEGLKRMLYHELTEGEYDHVAAGGTAEFVDHEYLQQLGMALITDDARWPRGGEYLRLAARGQPALGPTLFVQIAQAHQRAGNHEGARHNYELAKRAGQAVGPKNLADAERQAYFATVKMLGDAAIARGDIDEAIEDYTLFAESERSGLETLRTLADLYEKRGDPLSAARATDRALIYDSTDADLLARKDRYYYSILPEVLESRLEHVAAGFDVDYCLEKSRTILARYSDAEWLDVADHLSRLAVIVRPEGMVGRVLRARVLLRLGHRDEAVGLLEGVYAPKPEKFAAGDEEAWFQCCQLLGDLYLELGRADLAVPCLQEFRKSSKSGARTLFKLGQAFEALGDAPRATKCYEQVTAYDNNPLAPEAYDALSRLRA